MKNIYKPLDDFVKAGIEKPFGHRLHLNIKGFDTLYVRIATHCIVGRMARTLDISSVDVKESCQNKGLFKNLLKHCESLAVQYGLAVYIESVQNEHLAKYLSKIGYVSDGSPIASSFHKSHDTLAHEHRCETDSSPTP